MRYWLLLLILFQPFSTLQAQEDAVRFIRRFSIEAPAGYVNTHTVIHWSPTAEHIAIRFDILDDGRIPTQAVWQVFDVQTGNLIFEFAEFIAWYADGSRLLIRADKTVSPSILDVQTKQGILALTDAGTTFSDSLISDTIVSLDDMNTLRVHDAETGILRFSLGGVADLPIYAPDGSRFVVNILETGAQVYDTIDFSLLYRLDGYHTEPRYKSVWSPYSEQLIVVPQDDFRNNLGPRHIWALGNSLSEPIYNITGAIVWSPDSDRIAAPSDFTKVRIYDSMNGELLETIRGFADGPTASLQWEERYLLAGSGDYAFVPPLVLSVWDFEQSLFTLDKVVDVGFQYWLKNNELVVFEPFVGITRIAIETGATIQSDRFDRFLLPYVSPDRHWLIGAELQFEPDIPAPIVVYQSEPLESVAVLEGHTEIVRFISWSPTSRYFASIGGPNMIIIWEILEESVG